MRRGTVIIIAGLLALAGCSDKDAPASSSDDRPTTAVSTTESTTTTIPPEQAAFEQAVAANPGTDSLLTLKPAAVLAREICTGTGSGILLRPSEYPEIVIAAAAWQCPEQRAAIEQSIQVERAAAEEQRRQGELARAAAAEVGMSMQEFSEIQNGMTYSEVEAIVGSPGELSVSSEIAGYSGEIYTWNGEPGSGLGANAMVQLQNGRVVSKSQFGL